MAIVNLLHIHPLDDLIAHEMTTDCVCGPRLQPVKSGKDPDGWLLIHSSLDGREQTEQVQL